VTPRWRYPLRVTALAYLALLVVIPVGSVFYRAFQHGLAAAFDAVTTHDALHALGLTLLVVVIAVPLDTAFGVGVALILSRHRFRGAWLLDAFVDLPLAVSPVIVGLALILVYGRTGWFGDWLAARGIEVIFSVPGIVMASAIVALPYVVREVLPVLDEIGTDAEQAAATLGAAPWPTFRRITLPAIRRSLAFGMTIEGRTQTLTLFISDSVSNLDLTGAYAAAVILALIALAVLAVVGRGDKQGRKQRWPSPSTPSPNVSETPLLSMTSTSRSPMDL
jgi:sulfate transport system permease protein